METLTDLLANATYGGIAAVALLGAYHVAVILRRVSLLQFRNEQTQGEFLGQVEENLQSGDFDAAAQLCDGDRRAVPQLILLTLANRGLGLAKLRQNAVERFQRDVMADLEYRISWVQTVIKSAPMLGLFGTVLGMMGAFNKLAGGDKVDPSLLAEDIGLALVTTALGLAVAIPLILCTASINVRVRQLEDLVGIGLARFFDVLRPLVAPSEVARKS